LVDEVRGLSVLASSKFTSFFLRRFLKKIVIPTMADEGEVQRVNITLGKTLDADGQRLDVVSVKGHPDTFVHNVLSDSSPAWRWRLVPEDMREQQKNILAKKKALSPNTSLGSRCGR
jgi:hypothetical protein